MQQVFVDPRQLGSASRAAALSRRRSSRRTSGGRLIARKSRTRRSTAANRADSLSAPERKPRGSISTRSYPAAMTAASSRSSLRRRRPPREFGRAQLDAGEHRRSAAREGRRAMPSARSAASACSTRLSLPTVTGVPYGMRDDRQGDDGCCQVGKPSARDRSRISAFGELEHRERRDDAVLLARPLLQVDDRVRSSALVPSATTSMPALARGRHQSRPELGLAEVAAIRRIGGVARVVELVGVDLDDRRARCDAAMSRAVAHWLSGYDALRPMIAENAARRRASRRRPRPDTRSRRRRCSRWRFASARAAIPGVGFPSGPPCRKRNRLSRPARDGHRLIDSRLLAGLKRQVIGTPSRP